MEDEGVLATMREKWSTGSFTPPSNPVVPTGGAVPAARLHLNFVVNCGPKNFSATSSPTTTPRSADRSISVDAKGGSRIFNFTATPASGTATSVTRATSPTMIQELATEIYTVTVDDAANPSIFSVTPLTNVQVKSPPTGTRFFQFIKNKYCKEVSFSWCTNFFQRFARQTE